MTQYANQVTNYCAARIAAYQAGSGAMINFPGGVLVVGDGNGAVPPLSALIAANGVTHEVWRGATIASVAIDPDNAQQIDIGCVIPAVVGGAEVGPFTMREFALLDETGGCCVVGTANIEKLTSAQGGIWDIAFTVAIAVSTIAAVTVTPPSAGFATMVQVEGAINAHQPTALAPLAQTDTTDTQGWLRRVFSIRAATQALTGYGRAATQAEFDAGAAAAGGFQWPWPTLAQVKAALAAIAFGAEDGVKNLLGKFSLAFNALTPNSALAGGDNFARFRLASNAHAGATLAELLAWLRAQNKPLVPLIKYETAGVSTFTAASAGWVQVDVAGAGGGGGYGIGRVPQSISNTGAGGGSGGFARKAVYLTAGQQVVVTVGAGGAGQQYGLGTGVAAAGGGSSFGALLAASGGGGGANGNDTGHSSRGGGPGAGSGGDTNLPGAAGGFGAGKYGDLTGFGAPSYYGGGGAPHEGTLVSAANGRAAGSGGAGAGGGHDNGAGVDVGYFGGTGADGSVIVYT